MRHAFSADFKNIQKILKLILKIFYSEFNKLYKYLNDFNNEKKKCKINKGIFASNHYACFVILKIILKK